MNKWVGKHKSHKIMQLIDRQIVLQSEKLHLWVTLKRSLEARAINGEFRQDDIEAIRKYLGVKE